MFNLLLLEKAANKKTIFAFLAFKFLLKLIVVGVVTYFIITRFGPNSQLRNSMPLNERVLNREDYIQAHSQPETANPQSDYGLSFEEAKAGIEAKRDAKQSEVQTNREQRYSEMQEKRDVADQEHDKALEELKAMYTESLNNIESASNANSSATKTQSDEFLARKTSVEAHKAINESFVASLQP